MSYFTNRAPLKRPSMYNMQDFTQVQSSLPPSPPPTDVTDIGGERQSHKEKSIHRATLVDSLLSDNSLNSFESPSTRFRKASTVAYTHSGILESRVSARSGKWLVIVVPPSSFQQEPMHLGHTLSTSPAGRLSNGILMPLFPTLYSQLTAVAREFSMPSITGLCLYLQTSQAGSLVTPRISDETWPYLWGHLLNDPASYNPSNGPPIAGSIEFDVDSRKARWLHGWLGLSHKVAEPSNVSPPSFHARHETGTSLEYRQPDIDIEEKESSLRSTQHIRKFSRRFSLVGGDADSIDGNAKTEQLPLEPQGLPLAPRHQPALSPVPQLEESSASHEHDLVHRVTNWRDVASSSPLVPDLSMTNQTHVDPVDLPNSLPHSPVISSQLVSGLSPQGLTPSPEELNLNAFAWSISSAGPPTGAIPSSPGASSTLSIDLVSRVRGSVCLTPSTATSFGPDDELDCPTSVKSLYRIPSPDLAYRSLEDAPCTPSTATSWGPRSWTESPVSDAFDVQSVDIAHRSRWSQPVTPTTIDNSKASFVTPDTITVDVLRPDPIHSDSVSSNPPNPVRSFPYYSAWRREPWQHVWPYTAHHRAVEPLHTTISPELVSEFTWPRNILRGQVPHCNGQQVWSYNPARGKSHVSNDDAHGQFCMGQQSFVKHRLLNVQLVAVYPSFVLYPNVYPHVEVYPPITPPLDCSSVNPGDAPHRVSIPSSVTYPHFNIYPPIYPFFDIYPDINIYIDTAQTDEMILRMICPSHKTMPAANITISTQLPDVYPRQTLYHAVYPHIEPYPAVPHDDVPLTPLNRYPFLSIYPNVYPFIEPYPSLVAIQCTSKFYPALRTPDSSPTVPSADIFLPILYPNLTPYPPVYPHIEVYPGKASCTSETSSQVVIPLSYQYPQLVVYDSVYPYIEPYPVLDAWHDKPSCSLVSESLDMRIEVYYPCFRLYNQIYPWVEPYVPVSAPVGTPIQHTVVNIGIPSKYPSLEIYKPVYPFVEPYSVAVTLRASQARQHSVLHHLFQMG